MANATEKEDIHFSFANGYCNENGKDSAAAAVAKEIYNDLSTTTILREIPTDIWEYYYNTMWQHLVLYNNNNHNYMIYNPVVEYYTDTGFPLQKEEILYYGRNYSGTLVVHENYNMPGILQYTPNILFLHKEYVTLLCTPSLYKVQMPQHYSSTIGITIGDIY